MAPADKILFRRGTDNKPASLEYAIFDPTIAPHGMGRSMPTVNELAQACAPDFFLGKDGSYVLTTLPVPRIGSNGYFEEPVDAQTIRFFRDLYESLIIK